MTTRHAGWMAAIILTAATTARAEHQLPQQPLTVCLTLSEALEMDAPLETAVLMETTRIWGTLGVTVGVPEKFGNACDRWVLVKSALEARPEDATSETAIAWVPFVAKRARRVVFVRMSHARSLIEAFNPTNMRRPPERTEALLAKLVGRSLAHELGHVLLNSLDHEKSGLMRARYGADDTLRDLPTAYTLNARQLDRLFSAR